MVHRPISQSSARVELYGGVKLPESDDGDRLYKVVVNHEEQCLIWFSGRPAPPGCRDAAKSDPEAECVAYIDEVWADLPPISLRKRMEEASRITRVSA
jgi:MbtH protein